jgi:hypothetical protein
MNKMRLNNLYEARLPVAECRRNKVNGRGWMAVLLGLLSMTAFSLSASAALRVAMVDFSTDSNSYRSARARRLYPVVADEARK